MPRLPRRGHARRRRRARMGRPTSRRDRRLPGSLDAVPRPPGRSNVPPARLRVRTTNHPRPAPSPIRPVRIRVDRLLLVGGGERVRGILERTQAQAPKLAPSAGADAADLVRPSGQADASPARRAPRRGTDPGGRRPATPRSRSRHRGQTATPLPTRCRGPAPRPTRPGTRRRCRPDSGHARTGHLRRARRPARPRPRRPPRASRSPRARRHPRAPGASAAAEPSASARRAVGTPSSSGRLRPRSP